MLQSKALACAIQAIKRNWKSEAIVSAGLAVITNVFQNQEEVNHKEVVAALEGLRSILLRWIMKKSRPACLVAGSISCLSNISILSEEMEIGCLYGSLDHHFILNTTFICRLGTIFIFMGGLWSNAVRRSFDLLRIFHYGDLAVI